MDKTVLGGTSLNSLAQRAGIPLTTLRRRTIDPAQMTMTELLKLADALGQNPTDFFGQIKEALR